MKNAKTITVYTVLVDAPRRDDGISDSVFRFKRQDDAERFAAGNLHYGKPAHVQVDSVPSHIARRWGI